LKEVLNKVLSEAKTNPPLPNPLLNKERAKGEVTPAPISLNTLKNENKEKSSKDRAASAEDMDKLKNLIKTTDMSAAKEKVKEVPEDVLRKILG